MINSTGVAVSSVATLLAGPASTWMNTAAPPNAPVRVYLTNQSSAITIFVGGSAMTTVAATLGVAIPPTNVGTNNVSPPVEMVLYPGDSLFGISLSGTPTLSIVANGQSKTS